MPKKNRGTPYTQDQKDFLFELKMSATKPSKAVEKFNEEFGPDNPHVEMPRVITTEGYKCFFKSANNKDEYADYLYDQAMNLDMRGLANRAARVDILSDMVLHKDTTNKDRLTALAQLEGIIRYFEDLTASNQREERVIVQMPALNGNDPLLKKSPYFTDTQQMLLKLIEEHEDKTAKKLKLLMDDARKEGIPLPHHQKDDVIDIEAE